MGEKALVRLGGPTLGEPFAPPAEEKEVELIRSVFTKDGAEIVLEDPQLHHVNAIAQAAKQQAA